MLASVLANGGPRGGIGSDEASPESSNDSPAVQDISQRTDSRIYRSSRPPLLKQSSGDRNGMNKNNQRLGRSYDYLIKQRSTKGEGLVPMKKNNNSPKRKPSATTRTTKKTFYALGADGQGLAEVDTLAGDTATLTTVTGTWSEFSDFSSSRRKQRQQQKQQKGLGMKLGSITKKTSRSKDKSSSRGGKSSSKLHQRISISSMLRLDEEEENLDFNSAKIIKGIEKSRKSNKIKYRWATAYEVDAPPRSTRSLNNGSPSPSSSSHKIQSDPHFDSQSSSNNASSTTSSNNASSTVSGEGTGSSNSSSKHQKRQAAKIIKIRSKDDRIWDNIYRVMDDDDVHGSLNDAVSSGDRSYTTSSSFSDNNSMNASNKPWKASSFADAGGDPSFPYGSPQQEGVEAPQEDSPLSILLSRLTIMEGEKVSGYGTDNNTDQKLLYSSNYRNTSVKDGNNSNNPGGGIISGDKRGKIRSSSDDDSPSSPEQVEHESNDVLDSFMTGLLMETQSKVQPSDLISFVTRSTASRKYPTSADGVRAWLLFKDLEWSLLPNEDFHEKEKHKKIELEKEKAEKQLKQQQEQQRQERNIGTDKNEFPIKQQHKNDETKRESSPKLLVDVGVTGNNTSSDLELQKETTKSRHHHQQVPLGIAERRNPWDMADNKTSLNDALPSLEIKEKQKISPPSSKNEGNTNSLDAIMMMPQTSMSNDISNIPPRLSVENDDAAKGKEETKECLTDLFSETNDAQTRLPPASGVKTTKNIRPSQAKTERNQGQASINGSVQTVSRKNRSTSKTVHFTSDQNIPPETKASKGKNVVQIKRSRNKRITKSKEHKRNNEEVKEGVNNDSDNYEDASSSGHSILIIPHTMIDTVDDEELSIDAELQKDYQRDPENHEQVPAHNKKWTKKRRYNKRRSAVGVWISQGCCILSLCPTSSSINRQHRSDYDRFSGVDAEKAEEDNLLHSTSDKKDRQII